MTNEEIKKYANDLARKWWSEQRISHEWNEATEAELANFGRDLILLAYEEAAKAMCMYCDEGKLGEWHHDDLTYRHPHAQEDFVTREVRDANCEAQPIRILIDSLEPVAA